ncbi:C7orf60 [Cordylochernes scorpioides]|uniref:S-adenosylmethionine sensor upstream of mTORC1 n=1 Tax=Cordylochernes scorpioides TaxID=51811 RepID=A0ABY6LQ30_9ARAC|nr:C7orf60 [Cordylochernes scorpioides]
MTRLISAQYYWQNMTQDIAKQIKMASRQDELVKKIREVHQELRHAYQKDNASLTSIWQDHVKDATSRKKYSDAMLELATECWPSTDNRISWCYSVIRDYFYLGLFQRPVEKFCRINDLPLPSTRGTGHDNHGGKKLETAFTLSAPHVYTERDLSEMLILTVRGSSQLSSEDKVRLLDVGSCYNPFRSFPDLDTLAIDLSPAAQDVHQCDFLSVNLREEGEVGRGENGEIVALPTAHFHAVTLCLVLEYLPAPSQRREMCRRAASVLKSGGLLLIITPDSNSPHRNAPMMRSWKQGLSNLGLHRIKYLKQPHLHCMAFAKLTEPTCQDLLIDDDDFFFIPQDSQPLPASPPPPRTEGDNQAVQNMFDALPF